MSLATINNIPDAHRRIRQHLAALNLPEPAGVTRACDIDDALALTAAADPTASLRAGIADGTLSPAKAGKALADTAAAMLSAERSATVRTEMQPALSELARTALRDGAEQLVVELQPVFDTTVAAIAEALHAFGDQPDKVILRSRGLAPMLESRDAALDTMSHIRRLRTDLAEVGYGPRDETSAWYLAAPATELDATRRKPEHLIADHHTLHLNTAAEITELTAAANAEADALAERRAERKRKEASRHPLTRAYERHIENVRAAARDSDGAA